MAYFRDLTPYIYGDEENDKILNIGWLSNQQEFSKGAVSPCVISIIEGLLVSPVNLYRGRHHCEFCPQPIYEKIENRVVSRIVEDCPSGNGEIRVLGSDGVTYVAPELVLHYIQEHNYLPPLEFIQALESSSP